MNNEFYENIEEPIRPFIKLLRDNGINTTSSCGHKMWIGVDLTPSGELGEIHRLLNDYLAKNNSPIEYSIDVVLEVRCGYFINCFAKISIGGEDDTL